MTGSSWPGRADRRLGLVAGKLTFASAPRHVFRARRLRQLMAVQSLPPMRRRPISVGSKPVSR